MTESANVEGTKTEETKPPLKFESKPKAHIVLEDSDDESSGIVKDTQCDLSWIPGQGATVGTWSRSKVDGLIHIKLLTPIEALYDSAVNTWAKFAEIRTEQKKTRGKPGRKKKVVTDTPEVVSVPDEDKIVFNDMRARILALREKGKQ